MTESFEELFEQSLIARDLRPGSIVTGIVMEIRDDAVVVNAGLKSEGIVPIAQFRNLSGELEVAVGDEVQVALESIEDGFGETRLSRDKAKRSMVWDKLEGAFEGEETIEGKISGKVKGGFTVDIEDIRAFLPGSLVDVRPVRDPTYLEGKDLEFKIIKLDRKRNNIVVSRRAVVEKEFSAEREALLDRLEEGAIVKGVVKNLTDYGAFIDLGGIDGLLHITDMAWKRVRHPSEVVNVADELDVRVLRFDRERNRVSLGLKQLGEDPWSDLARRYPVGARLFGTISNITDYGCFVEIQDGVEGLVHVSEMDWTNKNVHPSKIVSLGDELEVMVLDIDEDRRRISLGIKQCQQNPWTLLLPSTAKAPKFPVTSSPLLTLVSLSGWRAISTVWCTCPTSVGMRLVRKLFEITRRATRLRRLSCPSILSASVFLWASNSWKTIPLVTTWPKMIAERSSLARLWQLMPSL